MRPKPLPSFLFPPWHVEEEDCEPPRSAKKSAGVRRGPSKAHSRKLAAQKKFGGASDNLHSVLHLSPEVRTLGQRMLEEHRLADWDIEIKPLCVWNFGHSSDPPYRHLRVGESIGTCRYDDKTIVIGIHPDLAESDYEKNVKHLVGNVLAAKSATALGKRLLKKYGLKEWKFITTRKLSADTAGIFLPVEKEIYLDPYKLSRPRSSIRETILHEIAHALAWPSGPNSHGPKWQKKARELGVSESDIAWHAKFGS